MASALVFSRVRYAGGPVQLVFGAEASAALRALVLKMGVICEVPAGEEGMHPPLRIVAGVLTAGGAGTNLVVADGVMRQATADVTTVT